MRHILSTALVALIVGSLAGLSVSVLAQEPAQESIAPAAGVDADRVDGKHAVSATTKKKARKNKLVATDASGYLPSNIVKPKWGLISEKPLGFADGVDDGLTKIIITTYTSPPQDIPLGGASWARDYACPSGKVMGGGYYNGFPNDVEVHGSFPLDPTTWRVWARSISGNARNVFIWVNCMTTEPSAVIARLSPAARDAVSTASKGGGKRRSR